MASLQVRDIETSTASATMLTRARRYATEVDWVARAILRPEETASFISSLYLSKLVLYALFYTKLTLSYEVLNFSFYLK